MNILFQSDTADPESWRRALAAEFDRLDFRIWPETGDLATLEAMLVLRVPDLDWAKLPNLRLIQLISAGADQLRRGPDLPEGVTVARLIEPGQVQGMVEYVTHAVLHHHRDFELYRRQQANRHWEEYPRVPARDRKVGVLGLGGLGTPVVTALAALGFDVSAWSRSGRSVDGATCYGGWEALPNFLHRNSIVVGLLPLTEETRDLYDETFFARMQPGSFFVNAGRGEQLVEPALIGALNAGHLVGATLDVLRSEPPGADDPIWTAPNLVVTPHVATSSNPVTGARVVAENIRRVRAGQAPLHQVR